MPPIKKFFMCLESAIHALAVKQLLKDENHDPIIFIYNPSTSLGPKITGCWFICPSIMWLKYVKFSKNRTYTHLNKVLNIGYQNHIGWTVFILDIEISDDLSRI